MKGVAYPIFKWFLLSFIFCNCLGTHYFGQKMPFLRLFLLKFFHVAQLRFKNCSFNIHKNAYFLP